MDDQRRSRGQIEAAIANAIAQFERDFLGRGPKQSRAFILQDMVVVRVLGVLTPAEQRLASEAGGVVDLKTMRTQLVERAREDLAALVATHASAGVVAMHTDLCVASGERVFLFVLDHDLETRLANGARSG